MILVCFDTETTGLDLQKDHIIQLSLVKFDTDTWQVLDTRDWYILPEGPFTIPAEAQAVHHISKEMLLERGVSLRTVYPELMAMTDGLDMLSYNGNGFDAQMLYYNLKRLGLSFDFEGRTWYDALLLERIHTAGMTDPATGEKVHNNLTAAYTRYYGHPFEGAHNSLDDVKATIEVFKAQIAAHGWEWAQRDEFGFISYDRWLTRKDGSYYLNQGSHKGQSLETVMQCERSYLDWIIDKCQWTDQQTRDIILSCLKPQKVVQQTEQAAPIEKGQTSSKKPVKNKKITLTDADLSLF